MPLRLYNTLTRTKEEFKPLNAENVRMYVCGPTVYDFAHIGNARPVIVFDVLFRLLRHLYGADHVKYVRNITDVDDKINARALRDFPDLPLNEAIRRVTETTASQFFADARALGCLEPTVQPRATDNIEQMIAMIGTLIDRGHAYVAAGEVLFSVPSMPDYGRLSQRNLDDQQAGARVAVEAHKRNPADFVLWKLSSAGEPGWDSPWGRGRPGWHIECSAMSKRYLGEVFDIHGGGLDLIFPHHENEIAQSRCAHGSDVMANIWMHNGFVQVNGKKMSKSDGNFVTVRDLFFGWQGAEWNGFVCRNAMLKTHYLQPIDWTADKLAESKSDLNSFVSALSCLTDDLSNFPTGEIDEEFLEVLSNDLDTPNAYALMHDRVKSANKGSINEAKNLAWVLSFLNLVSMERPLATLGGYYFDETVPLDIIPKIGSLAESANTAILTFDRDRLVSVTSELAKNHLVIKLDEPRSGGRITLSSDIARTSASVQELIVSRLDARKAKNWAESDRIRDELAAMGIAIKDNKDGTTSWEVRR